MNPSFTFTRVHSDGQVWIPVHQVCCFLLAIADLYDRDGLDDAGDVVHRLSLGLSELLDR